jgi:Flp pilus assembly pilin Flp
MPADRDEGIFETMLLRFWRDEEGQDLIEYTLLLAFVALVAAGLFIQAGNVTAGIWATANSVLTSASTAAVAGS